MRRRDFIRALGGVAAGWPLTARAQLSAMPVIGFLDSRSIETVGNRLRGFRQGLSEDGYGEGRNVAIEYRWAENQLDRIPELAGDLVHRSVNVIVASGGQPVNLAAKAATTTIPVVFLSPQDPVKVGLVTSLARPSAIGGRYTIPATYAGREYSEVGGLISYGSDIADAYRQVGVYCGHILKGAKVSELPVVQSSKLEIVVNAQTARMLGLFISPQLLARADEVIE